VKADITPALMLLDDYGGPYDMYRCLYKYTDCGPGVGFQIDGRWVYCDDLRQFGSWDDFQGHTIQAMSVSSIVEGVEQCTDTIILEAKDLRGKAKKPTRKTVGDAVFKAVAEVDQQANDIWNETHGCEECAKLLDINYEEEVGNIPVHPKCPNCNGCGTII
jgi:hypothetical protein